MDKERIEEIEKAGPEQTNNYLEMAPAVDWLSYEPNFLYKEFVADQEERIRQQSPYSHLQSWRLARVIIKSGDDMRLEQFAMQLISLMD